MYLDQAYCDTLAGKVQRGLASVPGGMEILTLSIGEVVDAALSPDVFDSEGWLNVAKTASDNLQEAYDPVFGEFGTESDTHAATFVDGIVSISPEASVLKTYGLDAETAVVFTVSELELIEKGLYTALDLNAPDVEHGLSVNQETDYLRSDKGVIYKLNKATPLNIQLLRPIIFVFAGTRRGQNPVVP